MPEGSREAQPGASVTRSECPFTSNITLKRGMTRAHEAQRTSPLSELPRSGAREGRSGIRRKAVTQLAAAQGRLPLLSRRHVGLCLPAVSTLAAPPGRRRLRGGSVSPAIFARVDPDACQRASWGIFG